MKILYFEEVGYRENSIKSLTSSTPVLDAHPSLKHQCDLSLILSYNFHKNYCYKLSIPFLQLRDFAKILAIVVLPTPRIPVNR